MFFDFLWSQFFIVVFGLPCIALVAPIFLFATWENENLMSRELRWCRWSWIPRITNLDRLQATSNRSQAYIRRRRDVSNIGQPLFNPGVIILRLFPVTLWQAVGLTVNWKDERLASVLRQRPVRVIGLHTITKEDRATMIPSFEHLVFQKDLGDQLWRCSVHEIANCTAERVHTIMKFGDHLLVGSRSPFRVHELLSLCLCFARELNIGCPTKPIAFLTDG